jgi:2-polyprenyl-3-methyl-5-hydroxy-6-metoxy-1,4-benzoquinol methylase
MPPIEPSSVRVLDIGCSIGTFAIEFARRGYKCVGLDMDADALAIARELAAQEGVEVDFVQGDVSAWAGGEGSVDIAVAFDLFEHLHDDEIGALLRAIRAALSEHGTLIYHTFPTELDHLFFDKHGDLWKPLAAMAGLPPGEFERAARAYALRVDAARLEAGGRTRREIVETHQHCNPLSRARLEAMIRRAGLRSLHIQTGQLFPYQPERQALFRGHAIADRNLWGAAAREP